MKTNNINRTKQEIRLLYKQFLKDRKKPEYKRNVTLKDILYFFNIFIEIENDEDYIETIDLKTPSIRILDTKNNIIYESTYTTASKLNDECYNIPENKNIIYVVIENKEGKTETIYDYDDKSFIVSYSYVQIDSTKKLLI